MLSNNDFNVFREPVEIFVMNVTHKKRRRAMYVVDRMNAQRVMNTMSFVDISIYKTSPKIDYYYL